MSSVFRRWCDVGSTALRVGKAYHNSGRIQLSLKPGRSKDYPFHTCWHQNHNAGLVFPRSSLSSYFRLEGNLGPITKITRF
jgi:hypothetical protein